jgi:hypothetical protein
MTPTGTCCEECRHGCTQENCGEISVCADSGCECHSTENSKTPTWEEEFDELFPFAESGRRCCMEPTEPHDTTFKSFISKAVSQARTEGLAEGERIGREKERADFYGGNTAYEYLGEQVHLFIPERIKEVHLEQNGKKYQFTLQAASNKEVV